MKAICNKKAAVFAIAAILILVSSVQGINLVGVEPVTDDSVNVNEGISLLDLDATIDNENYIINIVQPQPTNILAGTITIYVNTSAIDGRNDLNESQKTALKEHILDHIKSNFEGAVGEGNATVTDDPAQQGGADRNVSIEPGMSDPPGSAWGQCEGGNNTVKVFLGEFMNDSSVNGSFQNPDGSWNITKLGNAIGHTAGHEVAHTYSVGHNHEERPEPPDFLPPDENDNRSKMTAGENINATERANMRFDLDNHTIDVIGNNLGKDACVAFPDYDMKVLLAHYFGPTTLPDKPDEVGSLDVTFDFYTEMSGWFELGFLGEDTDNGVYDENSEFDFIYKTSLLNDEDVDAKILTFISEFHDYTTWILRGSEESPYPGEWFTLEEENVILSDLIETPDGDMVARNVAMSWPLQGVGVIFNATSFGEASNPYNGFTYDFVWEHKMHFPQLPDEDGWDVYATAGLKQYGYPEICLADDWMCTETGNVTDIHFWGSWKGGIEGTINSFAIAIAADIPANESSTGYSMPGTTLWERSFEDWGFEPRDPPSDEGWYNPYTGEILYNDHSNYFQYNIVDIIDPFYQIEGTIYWLSISAIVEYDETGLQPLWGWKSTEDHWNDDACWAEWWVLDWIDLWEPAPPITNQFWIAMDPAGNPDPALTGGTDYYDDGTSLNGWYYYPDSEWWNIWYYDHPLAYGRKKIIDTHLILSQWMLGESWVEIAINWATDSWVGYDYPPLPGCDEELYIGREIIYSGPAPETRIPIDYIYEILDYNPEWVSMDVRGYNFIIENGIIEHTCLQSLDLAFVITGEEPCTPGIDVEKYVWNETLGEWIDADAEADAIDIPTGTNAEFLITIHNNGTCCDLTDIYVYDFMDDSMQFVNADPYPDEVITVHGGTELYWYFHEPLSPCNWINITVTAKVVGPACSVDENYVYVEGYCQGTFEWVWDDDSAFVHAVEPCTPGIDVEKYVWNETLGDWDELAHIEVGEIAEFLITIHNNGTCCDLTDIYVYDFMEDSLYFVDAFPYPDEIYQIPGEGTELYWYFHEPLSPCNWINITVWAEVLGPVCHTDFNYVSVDGYCERTDEWVWDEDSAYVHAVEPCTPSIDVEKYVWDETLREWIDADIALDALDLPVDTNAEYLIAIHNDGDCCDFYPITVYDFLEDSMEYVSATPTPTFVNPVVGGTEILWFDLGPLSPCNWINITVQATVLGPACNTDYNYVLVEAYCESIEEYVYDEDYAYVHATEPPVPSVDVEKWVWDETLQEWVDYTEAEICTITRFNLGIHNTGQTSFIVTKVWDILPPCLEYADSATVNGDPREPDVITPPTYEWNYPLPADYWYPGSEPGELPPGEWIYIEFDVHVIGPPDIDNINWAYWDVYYNDEYYRFEDDAIIHPIDGEEPWPNHKMHYPQLPDPYGWDVFANWEMPFVPLADDWMCTETGPVTDIHFWGSWLWDMEGIIDGFDISIWDDIPDYQSPTGYSMPGTMLWTQYFSNYEMIPMPPSPQGWYDPFEGWFEPDNHMNYYQYNIENIIEPFIQESENVYWLCIHPNVVGGNGYPNPPLWGWKTSQDHWNDDAVYWNEYSPYGWIDLWEPPDFITSIDLSFVITGYIEDITPPVISNVVLTTSDPLDTDAPYGWENVTCNVIDTGSGVDEVKLIVTDPDSITVEYPMIKDGDTYSYNTTLTDAGDYTYHVWADDASDNIAESTPEAFILPPNYEVNMDGMRTIGFWDIMAVAGYYGDTGSNGWVREDVDNSGAVGFWDIMAVAGYYGESW